MNTTTQPAPVWMRLSCRIWGHVVDNHVFRATSGERRRCRCGAEYLSKTGETTHVRHTLSCFLRHHTYVRLTDRDGVHEYVCVRCGHPLAFPAATDPFANASLFTKKVRYACGLFGHRVTAVAARHGFVEYACHCGHSFLRQAAGERKIRHPLICFFRAHRIRFVEERTGYAEYVCEDCGHPFCFVTDERVADRPSRSRTPAWAGPSEPPTATPGTASAASSAWPSAG